MAPKIEAFNFGTRAPLVIPEEMPHPDDYVTYTAWHLRRCLRIIEDGPSGLIIPTIWKKFPVRLPDRAPRGPAARRAAQLHAAPPS